MRYIRACAPQSVGLLIAASVLVSCDDCEPDDTRAKCQERVKQTETVVDPDTGIARTQTNPDACPNVGPGDNVDGPIDVSFSDATRYEVDVTRLLTGDLTGDGNVDVITIHDSQVALFPGDGNGALGEPRMLPDILASATEVAIADPDLDGVDDLVAAGVGAVAPEEGEPPTLVAIYYGGDLETPQYAGFEHEVTGLGGSVGVGDFDADNNPDIALCISFGACGVMFGDGERGFGEFALRAEISVAVGSHMVVADLDGSGRTQIGMLNLLSEDANDIGRWFRYYVEDRELMFEAFRWGNASQRQAGQFVGVDLTGDGQSELVYTSPQSWIGVSWPDGKEYYHSAYCLSGTPGGNRGFRIALGDFNGDSELDIVANQGNGGKLTFLGKRPGIEGYMFPRLFELPGAATPDHFDVAAPDLNGDGLSDIVLADADGLSVMLNEL